MEKVLSFDIGGTAIKYGLVSTCGDIIWKREMETEAERGGKNILIKIKKVIEKVIEEDEIIGVAISTAGIVDTEKGMIKYSNGNIKEYTGLKLKEEIEMEFNLKTTVENDVNCAALGELWKGSAKGKENVFCITIGTGVGGAVIVNKRILKGPTFSSGEIGYLNICGETLDKRGSTKGIIERYSKEKEINPKDINGKIIFELAKNNDKIAIKEIDSMVESISSAIGMIAYIINPDLIIIGGGIVKQKDYLLNKFKENVKEKVTPYIYDGIQIKLAELENDAGIIGAVYNFINK